MLLCPAQHLCSVLYPGDNTPDWNPQCALNQVCIITHIHTNMCVCHTTIQYMEYAERLESTRVKSISWFCSIIVVTSSREKDLHGYTTACFTCVCMQQESGRHLYISHICTVYCILHGECVAIDGAQSGRNY